MEYCLEIGKKSENQGLRSGWRLRANRPRLGAIEQKEAVATDVLRLSASARIYFALLCFFEVTRGF
jgi:hypothetical protein